MSVTRAAVCLFYDQAARVDEYMELVLLSLRPFVSRFLFVANGALHTEDEARLRLIVDEVIVRENEGFDVGGYRAGLEAIGWEELGAFDELLLFNNTFFAPINPWHSVFEAAAAHSEASFWGLTEAPEVRPHPFAAKRVMPRHIQSHFIAVRSPLLKDPEFRSYWEGMPPIRSYLDSIEHHESRFTEYFESLGHSSYAVYPASAYASENPSILEAGELLDAGCPILKRRIFFHDPSYLDDHGVKGIELISKAVERGYPEDLLLAGVARVAPPRVLLVNAGLVEAVDASTAPWPDERLVLHAIVDSSASLSRLRGLLSALPPETRAVISCREEFVEQVREQSSAFPQCLEIQVEPCFTAVFEGESRQERGRGRFSTMLRLLAQEPEDARSLYIDCGDLGDEDRDSILNDADLLRSALDLFRTRPRLGLLVEVRSATEDEAPLHPLKPERFEAVRNAALSLGITAPLDSRLPLLEPSAPFAIRASFITACAHDPLRDEDAAVNALTVEEEELLIASAVASGGFHMLQVVGPGQGGREFALEQWRHDAARCRPDGHRGGFAQRAAFLRSFIKSAAPGLARVIVPAYRRLKGVFGR